MKVKYFSDTDTALVEFTDNEVVETKEIGENIYLDLDRNGITREHDHRTCPQQRRTPRNFLIRK